MDAEDIGRELDELAELRVKRLLLDMDKQQMIDQVMGLEIRAKIAEIEAEYQNAYEAVDQKIAEKTDTIRRDVLAAGRSVKGAQLMAVYSKGRVTWNAAVLDGLAIAIPQLASARSEGEPSVSIRPVK